MFHTKNLFTLKNFTILHITFYPYVISSVPSGDILKILQNQGTVSCDTAIVKLIHFET
jgi:hypothetical protein